MLTIPTPKQINVRRLIWELRQQFPEAVASWGAEGAVYVEHVDAGRLAEIQAALDAHDPALKSPEQEVQEAQDAVYAAAEGQAAAIPAWVHWTEAQALAWFDEHVTAVLTSATSLTEARPGLLALAEALLADIRMTLALRNHTWPHLEKPGG